MYRQLSMLVKRFRAGARAPSPQEPRHLALRELAVLPRLAPLLPLPIPTPVFRGRLDGGYPSLFFGAPLLAGHEVRALALADADRTRLARPLARFLRTLHAAGTLTAAGDLPENANWRTDMAGRARRGRPSDSPKLRGSGSG